MPINTDIPTPITSSSGPQRPKKGAKGKGKQIQKDEGKQKQDSAEPLPEGVDLSWEEAKDQFIWRLLDEYYFRSAGRSINPETAFAHTRNVFKEDLHRSVSDVFYLDCDRHRIRF